MKLTIYKFETDEVGNIAYPVLYSFSSSPGLSDKYELAGSHEVDVPEGTVINEGRGDSFLVSGSVGIPATNWLSTLHAPGHENLPTEQAIRTFRTPR